MLIEYPEKLHPLINSDYRFNVIYGGRGSAKSWTLADMLLSRGISSRKRYLCAREVQVSIKDSVHKLLADRIEYHNISHVYKVTDKSIIGLNGTEFLFKGLYRNINDIKSTEGLDGCWVEEAQSVSRPSLEILTPTVRKEGSQIFFTYNPTEETDPVHVDYNLKDRADTLKIEMNYSDNPWFPEVLRKEMEYDRNNDPDKYAHKWLGKCVMHSDAQIYFGKWRIEDFQSRDDVEFYYGADWGFSADPSCMIRNYVYDNILYIDYESWGYGVDIDRLPELFSKVPGSQENTSIADSSRPETISYMNRNGYPKMKSSIKGAGSVEEGISHIRSYKEIVIHPRCKHMIDEFRLYCYKIDKLTGLPTNKPEDKHNHGHDALRYSQEDIMRHRIGSANKVLGI